MRQTKGPRKLTGRKVVRRAVERLTATGKRSPARTARKPSRGRGKASRPLRTRATGPKGKAPKGFASKAQWRKFFADPRLRRYARPKAHATAGGPKVRYRRLPARKHPPGTRSAK